MIGEKRDFFCSTCRRRTEHKFTSLKEWLCSFCGRYREV